MNTYFTTEEIEEMIKENEELENSLSSIIKQRNELFKALKWYAETVSKCNRKDTLGDVARNRLARDYGQKAEQAIARVRGECDI